MMERALRKCLLDGGGKDWDELLPCVAMGYRVSRQKSVSYSTLFLKFGRDPIFQSRLQYLEEELDPVATITQLQVFLDERGEKYGEVMPVALRNLAIA